MAHKARSLLRIKVGRLLTGNIFAWKLLSAVEERNMTRTTNVVRVGAPDPEHETSPIIDTEIEEGEFAGFDENVQVCYFNGVRFASGDYVCSGDDLLRCENGVWVRCGSCNE